MNNRNFLSPKFSPSLSLFTRKEERKRRKERGLENFVEENNRERRKRRERLFLEQNNTIDIEKSSQDNKLMEFLRRDGVCSEGRVGRSLLIYQHWSNEDDGVAHLDVAG